MSALALFRLDDEVAPAPQPRRRLYAVRGTVDTEPAPRATSAVERAPASGLAAATAPTLDDLFTGAWTALSAGATATCPVCTSTMRPRWSAGAGAIGGRCDGCGSSLH
jgi:hypothetical protein